MEIAQEARERIARQAEARRTEIAENGAPENVASADASIKDDFQVEAQTALFGSIDIVSQSDADFLNALDITKAEYDQFSYLGSNDEVTRELIGSRTPEQFMDALATQTDDPSAQQSIELIKANPELAQAIHTAVVNDPTMLPNMQNMFEAEGADAFDFDNLNAALASDFQSNILTEVFTKIGDGSKDAQGNDIGYSHLERIIEAQKIEDPAKRNAELSASMNNIGVDPAGQIDFMQFISDFFRNPEMAINNLVNTLVEAGQMDPQMATAFKGLGASIGVPTRDLLQPYANFVDKYDIGRETPGRIVETAKGYGEEIEGEYGAPNTNSFEAPTGTETRTSNLDGVTSRTSFDPAATADSMMDDAATLAETVVDRDTEVAQVVPPSQMAGGLAGPG